MKMRKLLAWLLILAMSLSAFLFVGCNDNGGGGGGKGEVSEEELSPTFDGDLKTYSGDFKVLTRVDGLKTESFNIVDLVSDNNLGDTSIVKAVRERNELIKANFGVTIKRIQKGEKGSVEGVVTEATNAIQSSSITYDAFILPISNQIDLACNGGMLNLYDETYIDIAEADWWDGGVAKSLLLAGGAYFATGDLQTVDKDATYCTLFNESLLEYYGKGVTAGSLYDLVKDGNGKAGGWTMEKLKGYARDHANDNTDGLPMYEEGYSIENTNYGLYTENALVQVVLQAAGFTPTELSSTSPTGLKSNLDYDFQVAVTKVKEYFGEVSETSWYVNFDNVTGVNWDTMVRGSFANDRSTFFMCHAGTIEKLTLLGMQSNFGVLPIPKLYEDERQVKYGNTVQYYNCQSYSVPNRNDRLNEKSTYILEIMAYYSSPDFTDNSLNYNYYYKVLRGKNVNDTRAWEMLDLIFDTRTYDLVYAANIGTVWAGIKRCTLTTTAPGFVASDYGDLDGYIRNKLDALIGDSK